MWCHCVTYNYCSQPPQTPGSIFIEKLPLVLKNENCGNEVTFTSSSTVAMVTLNWQFSVTSQGLQSPLVKVKKQEQEQEQQQQQKKKTKDLLASCHQGERRVKNVWMLVLLRMHITGGQRLPSDPYMFLWPYMDSNFNLSKGILDHMSPCVRRKDWCITCFPQALGKMLDARQLGLKMIANVTYGYTAANFSGRMPCVEIADSIVQKGRETLERAIQLVNSTPEWRARVVYGDTDRWVDGYHSMNIIIHLSVPQLVCAAEGCI